MHGALRAHLKLYIIRLVFQVVLMRFFFNFVVAIPREKIRFKRPLQLVRFAACGAE